ncbi:MAG: phage virion morphogenesis protein [Azoarcus sp.]|jgi:phage gpG-like protein|nr:phage virion morphogenesis protein [Azoarcus sp.]
MFTITLTLNRAEMGEKLRALGELMRDPSPFLRAIGPPLVESTKKRIEAGGLGPNGEVWEPNSEETMRRAALIGGKRFGNKPLIDTGILMETITYQISGGTLYIGTGRFADKDPRITSTLQFGTTRAGRGNRVKIPPRPYLGISDDDEALINRAIENEVRSILGA